LRFEYINRRSSIIYIHWRNIRSVNGVFHQLIRQQKASFTTDSNLEHYWNRHCNIWKFALLSFSWTFHKLRCKIHSIIGHSVHNNRNSILIIAWKACYGLLYLLRPRSHVEWSSFYVHEELGHDPLRLPASALHHCPLRILLFYRVNSL
jgi:hypothetical protein